MKHREIDKLDDIDRNVIVWCARNQAQFVTAVLDMYQKDYKSKGINLDVSLLLTELNWIVWHTAKP